MYKEKVAGNTIEGESYVGKTSAIEVMKNIDDIRNKGIIIVPEYSVIGKLPKFPRETLGDLKESIQTIIDLEKRRTDGLTNELAKNKNGMIVFDRGPVSCIAFEYAAKKAGYQSAMLWLADAFQKELENDNIIVPAGMIHLTASRDIVEEREQTDLQRGHGKILDFLKDPEVIKNLNFAFNAFGESLPKQLFLTLDSGGKNPEQVAWDVLQFIKEQPEEVKTKLPDFVKYAESLLKKKDE